MNQDELERQISSMKGETVIFPKDGEYAIKHASGSVTAFNELPYVRRQRQLVEILCNLTNAGKATWLRRKADIRWLYCFIDQEQIIVEFPNFSDDEASNTVVNLESLDLETNFVIRYRDERFLYLGGLADGDTFIRFIKSIEIPIDDQKVGECHREWEEHLLDDLIELERKLR